MGSGGRAHIRRLTSRDLNRCVSSNPGLAVSKREPSRQLERRAGELQVIRWPERRILRCHRAGLRDLQKEFLQPSRWGGHKRDPPRFVPQMRPTVRYATWSECRIAWHQPG